MPKPVGAASSASRSLLVSTAAGSAGAAPMVCPASAPPRVASSAVIAASTAVPSLLEAVGSTAEPDTGSASSVKSPSRNVVPWPSVCCARAS
ncbi:MAG: hypothetical protein IPJ11_11035 [Gemmatimonadetes bacterium]|nr:hypothetical protein [Gemmatimonadota bacterium]